MTNLTHQIMSGLATLAIVFDRFRFGALAVLGLVLLLVLGVILGPWK